MKTKCAANRNQGAATRVQQPACGPRLARSHWRSRRGVALIIVLGLLGLLLISAVSFAVLMRTERNAATNYRHTSSARQMLFASLARAIEAIDADIGDDLCPAWTNRTVIVGSGSSTNRTPDGMLFSYFDPGGTDQDPVVARLLTTDVMTYIPVLYHRRLTEAIYNPPEWTPFNYDGSVIGRYAYAIIDTSGLLDAHLVYSNTVNRWRGTSMGEVRLNPTILTRRDITNVVSFTADRDSHRRYETIAELATLNRGINHARLANFEVYSTYGTNAPPGAPLVNLHGLTNLTVTSTDPDLESIIASFNASGIFRNDNSLEMTVDRDQLACIALRDYIDDDSVMSSYEEGPWFDRPCTEKVPMISSFGVTMEWRSVVGDGGDPEQFTHTITYYPELKFVNWPAYGTTAGDAGTFSIRGALYVEDLGRNDYGIGLSEGNGTRFFPTHATYESHDPNGRGGYDEEDCLGVSPLVFTSAPMPTPDPPFLEFNLYCAFEVYNRDNQLCYQFPGDKELEQFMGGLPAPDDDTTRFPVATWATINNIGIDFSREPEQSIWFECVDPRVAYWFDLGAGRSPQWYCNINPVDAGVHTFDSIAYDPRDLTFLRRATPLQKAVLEDPDLAERVGLDKKRIDGYFNFDVGGGRTEVDEIGTHFRMQVANAPLQTVGELGYLLIGPWETVKLYPHFPSEAPTEYHTVLDRFEMRDPAVAPKGKVNLNSATADVLSLLYLDMPLRSENPANYRDGPWALADEARPLTIDTPAPQEIGELLYNAITANRPVTALSDLAKLYSAGNTPVVQIQADLTTAGGATDIGEFEREAVIRNIAGLLTVKQQMFTIILRADAFTTRFASDRLKDGTVLSSATAIAQVTREAVAGAGGRHKTTVRLLKILE